MVYHPSANSYSRFWTLFSEVAAILAIIALVAGCTLPKQEEVIVYKVIAEINESHQITNVTCYQEKLPINKVKITTGEGEPPMVGMKVFVVDNVNKKIHGSNWALIAYEGPGKYEATLYVEDGYIPSEVDVVGCYVKLLDRYLKPVSMSGGEAEIVYPREKLEESK